MFAVKCSAPFNVLTLYPMNNKHLNVLQFHGYKKSRSSFRTHTMYIQDFGVNVTCVYAQSKAIERGCTVLAGII